jgi:hypothetical protein
MGKTFSGRAFLILIFSIFAMETLGENIAKAVWGNEFLLGQPASEWGNFIGLMVGVACYIYITKKCRNIIELLYISIPLLGYTLGIAAAFYWWGPGHADFGGMSGLILVFILFVLFRKRLYKTSTKNAVDA